MKAINKFKNNTYAKYTFLFIITSLITFIYFAIYGKSFVWNMDGFSQHGVALTYYGQWLRELFRNFFVNGTFTFPMWNFSIGYGGDILTTLCYYVLGDPLNLLSALVPSAYTEYLYLFLIFLRLYLAGLFFIIYCKTMGKTGNKVIICAMIYLFTSYTMFAAVRHPFFVLPMMLFPLVLTGFEKIMQGKRPYLFIGSILLSVICNFYFFYMIAILTAIYGIVRIICTYKKDIKSIFSMLLKVLLYSVIGILLGASLFIPILLVFFADDRSGISQSLPILYSPTYYPKLLSGLISADFPGEWTFMGYSPLATIGIYFAFAKKNIQLKILYIISIIMIAIPICGSFMNGFSYAINRWIWAFGMLVAFSIVYFWDNIVNLKILKNKPLIITLAIYIGIILIFKVTRQETAFINIILLLATILAISCINASNGKCKKYRTKIILASVLLSIGFNAFYIFNVSEKNYITEFFDAGEVYNSYLSTASADMSTQIKDEGFYRFSSADDEQRGSRNYHSKLNMILDSPMLYGTNKDDLYSDFCSNSALLFNQKSIGYYWSLGNNKIAEYLSAVDAREYPSFFYYGIDSRQSLLSLSSVKYFVCEATDTGRVPYGYKFVKSYTKSAPYGLRNKKTGLAECETVYNIYQNKYTLPFSYTYDTTVTKAQVANWNGIEKENMMLSKAIVDEKDSLNTDSKNLHSSCKMLNYDIEYSPEIYKNSNVYYTFKPDQSLKLKFKARPNTNLYVHLKNYKASQRSNYTLNRDRILSLSKANARTLLNTFTNFSYSGEANISVMDANVCKLLRTHSTNTSYYNGRTNFVINMGYSDKERNEVTILFEGVGAYTLDDIEIFEQPQDNLKTSVKKLSKDQMTDLNIKDNKISGKIKLDKPKLLCLNIPFCNGWTATVDGKETKLINVNYMNSGLVLDKGEHTIVLNYVTPGLMLGIFLSLPGSILLILIIIIEELKRRKTK